MHDQTIDQWDYNIPANCDDHTVFPSGHDPSAITIARKGTWTVYATADVILNDCHTEQAARADYQAMVATFTGEAS